ncbi:type I pantothenate kinase [Longispora albida]|uniref:type I pantothenate kinase n=1 Tax=Longispora albida TaxID=203523 RepID=UPI00038053F0|nr:type I pantothenate kinase [Longispora albida]
MTHLAEPLTAPAPWWELERSALARLASGWSSRLSPAELEPLRSLGDRLDATELAQVLLPVALLVEAYATGTQARQNALDTLLASVDARGPAHAPFVIGIAGGVAVGKSTVARVLRELLARGPGNPHVELITTDGFLLPNAELTRRDLMSRKGFPESYNARALRQFLAAVKGGAEAVSAPVYSHLAYDVLAGERVMIRKPDVLIVEGINVLQPPRTGPNKRSQLAVSDFFDFSIYVDARLEHVRQWYVERFLTLRRTAFANPASFFHRYASLSDTEAVATAQRIFREINEVNLVENIRPTRSRANLVLRKGGDHAVERVLIRH